MQSISHVSLQIIHHHHIGCHLTKLQHRMDVVFLHIQIQLYLNVYLRFVSFVEPFFLAEWDFSLCFVYKKQKKLRRKILAYRSD